MTSRTIIALLPAEPLSVIAIFAVVFTHAPARGQIENSYLTAETQSILHRLSADSIYRHLEVLGNDSLQGRGTGSAGNDKAAAYLARQMQKLGLQAVGDNQTYFQNIPMHGSSPQRESRLQLSSGNQVIELALWSDYLLFSSGAQTFIPTPLPMTFVGYGILAPEFDYNDYQNIDARNRIVVFLAGEPMSDDPDFFDAHRTTRYSDPAMKHRIAMSRGARGSIMIPTPRNGVYADWSYWVRQFLFEDIDLPYTITNNLNVLVNIFKAHLLFTGAKYSWDEVLALDAAGTIKSFPLNMQASFHGEFRERDFVSKNVIGMLESTDPVQKDAYIIVSAHYDHLGIGTPVAGDSIYNGVLDNAIGTSAVLELARGFTLLEKPPLRSVLFLFVTGEEKGLLGSRYYCDQPVVPLHKTIAAINVDGIATLDELNSITGIGTEYSTLGQILSSVTEMLDIEISAQPDLALSKEPLLSSDQFSFAQAGIPAVMLMEGLDYQHLGYAEGVKRFFEWGRKIYHSPFDDLHQPINKKAMLQHTQILFAFISAVANSYITPQWLAGSEFVNARLQSISEKR